MRHAVIVGTPAPPTVSIAGVGFEIVLARILVFWMADLTTSRARVHEGLVPTTVVFGKVGTVVAISSLLQPMVHTLVILTDTRLRIREDHGRGGSRSGGHQCGHWSHLWFIHTCLAHAARSRAIMPEVFFHASYGMIRTSDTLARVVVPPCDAEQILANNLGCVGVDARTRWASTTSLAAIRVRLARTVRASCRLRHHPLSNVLLIFVTRVSIVVRPHWIVLAHDGRTATRVFVCIILFAVTSTLCSFLLSCLILCLSLSFHSRGDDRCSWAGRFGPMLADWSRICESGTSHISGGDTTWALTAARGTQVADRTTCGGIVAEATSSGNGTTLATDLDVAILATASLFGRLRQQSRARVTALWAQIR
mmetsp:Transcript_22657/g.59775  ORF Transcript_22657/g.59775 Transcript_22657/m.59775 type:complete len:366 (+) Transcript_22657:161-1258(+)